MQLGIYKANMCGTLTRDPTRPGQNRWPGAPKTAVSTLPPDPSCCPSPITLYPAFGLRSFSLASTEKSCALPWVFDLTFIILYCNNQEGMHFHYFFWMFCHFYLKTGSAEFGFSRAVLSWESGRDGDDFAAIEWGWGRCLRNLNTDAKL